MAEPDNTLELTLAKVLSLGVLVSGGFLILGLAGMLVTGQTGYPAAVTDFSRVRPEVFPHTPGAILAGLREGRPLALVSLGLLVLILTPMLRVASAVVLYFREHDWLYTGIAGGVLLMLVLGMALGAH